MSNELQSTIYGSVQRGIGKGYTIKQMVNSTKKALGRANVDIPANLGDYVELAYDALKPHETSK